MQFKVDGSIILLFATEKKWDLQSIKLKAATAQGIFFEADCPAMVIDRTKKRAISVGDADEVFAAAGRDVSSSALQARYGWSIERSQDVPFVLDILRQESLALLGQNPSKFERRFTELFFQELIERSERELRFAKMGGEDSEHWTKGSREVCRALMPIPQAWFYCDDPLEPYTFIPENAFRVDFAFWSGEKFYAVEIDGSEPSGYAADVRRDRLLRRAGIDVIHILNSEIMQHAGKIVSALLPRGILRGSETSGTYIPFALPF